MMEVEINIQHLEYSTGLIRIRCMVLLLCGGVRAGVLIILFFCFLILGRGLSRALLMKSNSVSVRTGRTDGI